MDEIAEETEEKRDKVYIIPEEFAKNFKELPGIHRIIVASDTDVSMYRYLMLPFVLMELIKNTSNFLLECSNEEQTTESIQGSLIEMKAALIIATEYCKIMPETISVQPDNIKLE